MTRTQIVEAFNQKMESADLDGLRELLHADYQHLDAFMPPLKKEALFEFVTALKEAFPDWQANLKVVGETEGDTVKATFAPTATHTGVFRFPGITPVEPTGITLALPRSLLFFRFKGDKIVESHVEHPTYGGMAGVLRYLGVELDNMEDEH